MHLAHFGKKGMNWGLRRTQPYGTGYIRKNGKRGLEMLGLLTGDSSNQLLDYPDELPDADSMQLDPSMKFVDEEYRKSSDTKELRQFLLKLAKKDLYALNNPLDDLKDAKRIGEWIASKIKTAKNDDRISKAETYMEMDPETKEMEATVLKKKDRHWTEDEDMAAVNPSFKNFDANTKNNCMLCTTTYDLRRRGFDVTADIARSGYNQNELRRWYPDAKVKEAYHPKTTSELMRSNELASKGINKECTKKTVNELLKQPDGARGNLMVYWGGGGGHSVVYEVKQRKVIIRDCQTNKVYKNPGDILDKCHTADYARLDNVRVNTEYLSEVVKH